MSNHIDQVRNVRRLILSLPPLYIPIGSKGIAQYKSPACTSVNLEHVFPKSRICLSDTRKIALVDMHNMFSCPISLNSVRGNLRFSADYPPTKDSPKETVISTVNMNYRSSLRPLGYGNYILSNGRGPGDQLFVPNPQSRGTLARAILYMCDRYDCDPDAVVEGGESTVWKWNRDHPPSPYERLHHYLVFKQYRSVNKFITNQTSGIDMLKEIEPPAQWPRPALNGCARMRDPIPADRSFQFPVSMLSQHVCDPTSDLDRYYRHASLRRMKRQRRRGSSEHIHLSRSVETEYCPPTIEV